MHITSHLDFDLIALDREDDVTCLVQLVAPMPPDAASRPGQGIVIVLDRSGSMAGEPLAGAKAAIRDVVRRLSPQDCLGVVVFDDRADVVVPVSRVDDLDRRAVDDAIASIWTGGATDLSAGYIIGVREAERAVRQHGAASATVLLISDGEANAGIEDPVILRGLAQGAHASSGVTTATVGLGMAYDEVILEALARGGAGEHRFAPDIDAATRDIADLVGDLLAKSVVGAVLRVRPQDGLVGGISLRQDLPHWTEPDALAISLGDLYGGEERSTLLRIHVPRLPALGLATVAHIDLEYTSLPDLQQHSVTVPISVNVVPGDEAAGRVPNPLVQVEDLLVDVDDAKRSVAMSLRSGDSATARRALADAIGKVSGKRTELRGSTDQGLTARLAGAAEDLLALSDDALHRSAEYSSKSAMGSYAASSRGRKAKPSVTPTSHTGTDDEATGDEEVGT